MAIIDRRGITVDDSSPSSSNVPSAGVAIKLAVRAATTANLTLAGLQIVDGVAVVDRERVLVKNQSDAKLNGIYNVSTGNWLRTVDVDGELELAYGTRVLVLEGATLSVTEWFVSTENPVTIGTSSLVFTQAGSQPLDATLTALAAFDASVGLLVQAGPDSFTKRTLAGAANEIAVANGDGVSGDPTISLPAILSLAGKTMIGGVYAGVMSINGNFWTTGSGTLTLGAGKTLTVHNSLTFTGLDGTIFSTPTASDILVGRTSTDTLTNKSINANSNTVTNLTTGMFAAGVVDTDAALTANSDTRFATQKATKTYVDQIVSANDAMVYKGVIDCSTNPNYPAGDRGWTYRISVAGRVGGALGLNVEVGDILLCLTDGTPSGAEVGVGLSWSVIQVDIDGAVTLTGPQTLTNKVLTSPAITTPTGIVKGDIGLGNVDNTSDSTKNAANVTLTNKAFNTASNTFTLDGAAFGTAAQATAALNVMVGDTGTGGTKGLVPAAGNGDGAASKFLKADGTWAVPAGSGGGGITDAQRQNMLLNSIYQAKLLVGYRRTVLEFHDGFKASDGINAGSSSNYTIDTTSGRVYPTAAADVRLTDGTPTAPLGGTAANFNDNNSATQTAAAFLGDLSAAPLSSRIVAKLDFGSAQSITKIEGIGISQPAGSVASGTGGGFWYSTDGANYTQALDFGTNSTPTNRSITATISARYIVFTAGMVNWSGSGPIIRDLNVYAAGIINDMMLVTTTQTADASVSNARVLIEFDPIIPVSLNTDLTVEVTCDGGAHWSSATLSAVTSYSGGTKQRCVAETADTACMSGTSWAARIKALNSKNVHIYGVAMTVH